VAILLVQWMIAAKASAAKKPAQRTIPNVEVSEVQLRTVRFTVESQGTVQPKQRINLISEVAGAAIWVSSKMVNGGEVVQGELLLKIDPINYEVAVAEAKSALANAQLSLADEQAEYKRGTAYGLQNKRKTTSLRKYKLATVEAAYVASKERVRQAEHQLNKTQIIAPFDGLVSAKAVDVGQYVSVGSVLFNLMGTAVAEIELPINMSELQYLSASAESANVVLHSSVGYGKKQKYQQWQAKLTRVEGFVDEDTRVVKVVAELVNPYGSTVSPLSMGMFVEADIVGDELVSAIRIPTRALHGDKVYLAVGGQLMSKPVTIYRQETQQVVISDGLNDGDLLVMTRLDLMVEGMDIDTQLNQSLLPLAQVNTEASAL
jgi:RND family efflux transporter MFP subunit